MREKNTAYFVRMARRVEDLSVPHLLNAEKAYEIVKIVELEEMDYENFTTDLLADREFLCAIPESRWNAEILKCVLVRGFGKTTVFLWLRHQTVM